MQFSSLLFIFHRNPIYSQRSSRQKVVSKKKWLSLKRFPRPKKEARLSSFTIEKVERIKYISKLTLKNGSIITSIAPPFKFPNLLVKFGVSNFDMKACAFLGNSEGYWTWASNIFWYIRNGFSSTKGGCLKITIKKRFPHQWTHPYIFPKKMDQKRSLN